MKQYPLEAILIGAQKFLKGCYRAVRDSCKESAVWVGKGNEAGITNDVKERIVSIADILFEQSDRKSVPTVDEVRRAARVDMNAASQVMRDWRRKQTAQSTPIVVNIPEPVHTAAINAVVSIWQQAQELANENLKNAQSAWEQERNEQDNLRTELVEAFDLQNAELEQLKAKFADAILLSDQKTRELEEMINGHHITTAESEKAMIKYSEIERHLNELRIERDDALKGMQQAREKTANLEGALEAMETQNKRLLEAIGHVDKDKS